MPPEPTPLATTETRALSKRTVQALAYTAPPLPDQSSDSESDGEGTDDESEESHGNIVAPGVVVPGDTTETPAGTKARRSRGKAATVRPRAPPKGQPASMERPESDRKHKRGQLTDNMYALFRQATVTDISTDLNYKKKCAELLQEVFAELQLPADQVKELVEFALDPDARSSGSKKRVENRQNTSAAAATPDASLAASQNSYRAGARAVVGVADPAVQEDLGPYVTAPMIEAWSKSLRGMSVQVDEIFKFYLQGKFTEGEWNVEVLIDFVYGLLREHVSTREPVNINDFYGKQRLARFQSDELSMSCDTFVFDLILGHLPAEIFLACATALGDMSLNYVVLQHLHETASAAPFSEQHAYEVAPAALMKSGRLTLRFIEYPNLTSAHRAFRFCSELFVTSRLGTLNDLSRMYPGVSGTNINGVYSDVYNDLRVRHAKKFGWMFRTFSVASTDAKDFGNKYTINGHCIPTPLWVNHNSGTFQYVQQMAPLFATYFGGGLTVLSNFKGVTNEQRELLFLSLFSSVDFYQDWRSILPDRDVVTMAKIVSMFAHPSCPPALFLIADASTCGSNPLNPYRELFNFGIRWQYIREKIPDDSEKNKVDVLLLERE